MPRRLIAGLLLALVPVASAVAAGDAAFVDRGSSAAEPAFVPRPALDAVSRDNLLLVSVLAAHGEPLDGSSFTVLREEPDVFGKPRFTTMATSGPQAFASFRLAPGRYRVQVRNGAVLAEDQIELSDERPLRHEVVLNAGRLQLQAQMAADGTPADDTWFRVLRDDTDAFGRPARTQVAGNGYAAAAEFTLPSGHYVVEATCGNVRKELPVLVDAGAVTEQVIDLDAGRVELYATLVAGGEAAAATRFEVFSDHPRAAEGSEREPLTVAEPTDRVAFVLPAGDYRVEARLGAATARLPLRIEAGSSTSHEMPLHAGELVLMASLAGHDEPLLNARFEITPLDTDSDATATTVHGPSHRARAVLPAGAYRVTARVGESARTIETTVHAGEPSTEVVTLDAARVSLSLQSPREDARPFDYTWFSVYRVEQDGRGGERRRRVFNDGYFNRTELVLPAGRYVAQARHRAHSGELDFEVTPGEIRQLPIVARF